jgi:zinc protease
MTRPLPGGNAARLLEARARAGAQAAERPVPRLDLGDGATLLFDEDHTLPLVSITVAMRSGSAHDPAGKEGASRLATRMLRRGAAGMSAKDIEDQIDRLGGELSTDVAPSSSAIEGQVIERNLEPFVDLFAKILGAPGFPEDELTRLKRETVAEIIEARDSDRALAQRAFRRALFTGHLYGRSTTGTPKSVESLTDEDVQRAYALHVNRGNVVVGLSGDVDPADAKRVAERLVSAIPAGQSPGDPIAEPEPRKGRRLVFVDKPERTQTQILIGSLGTSPFDPDHVPLGVANAVFGGSFTSRLMREVRSKRGWSYGASARLGVDRHRQSFAMWTFPAATDAAACVRLELELLEAFVDKGITPKELSFIKRYLMRSRAFDVDTASKRLHQALDVGVLGLPLDYHSSYLAKVGAVTCEEANAAVRARIHPDETLVVVVGTADAILAPVRDAIEGLTEHEVVAFDED